MAAPDTAQALQPAPCRQAGALAGHAEVPRLAENTTAPVRRWSRFAEVDLVRRVIASMKKNGKHKLVHFPPTYSFGSAERPTLVPPQSSLASAETSTLRFG